MRCSSDTLPQAFIIRRWSSCNVGCGITCTCCLRYRHSMELIKVNADEREIKLRKQHARIFVLRIRLLYWELRTKPLSLCGFILDINLIFCLFVQFSSSRSSKKQDQTYACFARTDFSIHYLQCAFPY